MRPSTIGYGALAVLAGAVIWLTTGDDARLDPLFFLRDLGGGAAIAPPEPPPAGPAAPVRLGLPLACDPGRDCFVSQYVDAATGPGFADYRCGSLAEDGGTATVFRLRSFQDMEAGVAARATAGGLVAAVRDGMADVSVNLVGRDAVDDRPGGNSLAIRHDDGLYTTYKHLRRGSIRVREGDRVRKGQVVAEVGMSGAAAAPQLAFTVRRDATVIDPFTGYPAGAGCGRDGAALWDAPSREALAYVPTLVPRIGFARQALNMDALEFLMHRAEGVFPRDTRQVVMHVLVLGLREGDRARIRITAPDGRVMNDRTTIATEPRARRLIAASLSGGDAALPIGQYTGRFTLVRPGPGGAPVTVFDLRRGFELR